MSLPRLLFQRLPKCRTLIPPQSFLHRTRNFSTTNRVLSNAEDYLYRNQYHPKVQERSQVYTANFISGFFWFWVLYHLWYEYEELFPGEWPWQDPAQWTDEELGIPPDDYDE